MAECKAVIMDEVAMHRALRRIAHEIVERASDAPLALVGIRRRGVPLAEEIAQHIGRVRAQDGTGDAPPVGSVDITLYRDDLTTVDADPKLNTTDVPFDINGKTVVLVDDVLFTGRTARAAIDAIFRLGRPAAVRMAILIDRGHRELPIRADYVGKNIPTSRREMVAVCLPQFDGRMCVELWDIKNEASKPDDL